MMYVLLVKESADFVWPLDQKAQPNILGALLRSS
jgi:hypothetical protein